MFDKLHVTIVINNMVFGWKLNVNNTHFHPLIEHICIVVCDEHVINLVKTNNK
jgi:hypothetical protein